MRPAKQAAGSGLNEAGAGTSVFLIGSPEFRFRERVIPELHFRGSVALARLLAGWRFQNCHPNCHRTIWYWSGLSRTLC